MHVQYEELKVVFVGYQKVWKTSIIKRFEQNSFKNNLAPSKKISSSEKFVEFTNRYECIIKSVDFPGDESCRESLETEIKDVSIVVLVYSLDHMFKSEEDLNEKWLNEIRPKASGNAIIFLVINKIDLLKKYKEFDEDKIIIGKKNNKKSGSNCCCFY